MWHTNEQDTPRTSPNQGWRRTITQFRIDKGMSQREFAEWLGVGRMSIQRWELGINAPSLMACSLLRAKGIMV